MKRHIKFVLFLLILLVLTTCTIKKPQAPEWDIELALPIIDEIYYMSDFADTTDDFIFAVVEDTMQFSISKDIETMKVGDELKVDGQTETFEKQIGDELKIDSRNESFSIPVGDSLRLDGRDDSFVMEIGDKLEIDARQEQFSVSVGNRLEINEQSRIFERELDKIEVEETGESYASVGVLDFARSAIPGVGEIYNHTLPPIYNFPPIDTNFTIFENDNIEYVVIDSGWAYIDFTNSTEMPLSSNDPQHYMNIEIYGEEIIPENLILTHYIDHVIQAGASENIELDLTERKVYRQNFLRINLTTDGTGSTPIDVLEEHIFIVILSVSEMKVSEASAKLPSEYIEHEDAISIQDETGEVLVVSAEIDSCLGNIFVQNNLPIFAHATIHFVELLDESDNPLQILLDIPPFSNNNFPLDFADYKITSRKQEPLDSLHFFFNVVTDSTDVFVTIDESQNIYTKIDFGKMKFKKVIGYVIQSFEYDDSFSIEDASGEIILEEAVIKSGEVCIQLAGLSFVPTITIRFDEIKKPDNNSLELIIDDFPYTYNIVDHKIVVELDQIIQYHVIVDLPENELITIRSSDYANTDINLSQFIFESVTGTINKTFDDEGAISIRDEGDEILIEYAKIKNGAGQIIINNNLPFTADGTVTFVELYDNSNNPYSFDFSIQGNDIHQEILNLAGFSIHNGKQFLDSLHYSFDVTTIGSGTINYTDSVYAEIELGEMFFEEVTGKINIEFSDDDSISVEDSTITLQSAEISEGSIDIEISGLELNPDQTTILILFDEIFDQNDNPLELEIDDFQHFTYDFFNHEIILDPEDQTLHYHTNVAINQSLTISYDDTVKVDITLSEMIFETVTGKFGSFTFEDSDATEIDSTGEFSLYYAIIDSCDVTIEIKEEDYSLPFGADIEIVFEEIYNPDGEVLIINLHCPGDTTIILAEHTIGDNPSSTTSIDSLHYSYKVVTDSTSNYVTVDYQDEVKANIVIGDMIFQKVFGVIDHKRIELEDMDEEIDLGDIPDSLQDVFTFQNAELHLEIFNGIEFDCELNLHMVGYNDSGDSATVDIERIIIPGENPPIIVTEGVSELLNILPTHIKIMDSYAVINGAGTITKEDSISGSYTLLTPLKFIINDKSGIRPDSIIHIEINEDNRNIIEKNLNSMKLFLTTENLLPFGSGIKICFAADSSLVWDNPELTIDSLIINPATIDTINHVSGDMIASKLEIELNNEQGDFDVFINPDVYLGIEFGIIGTNGQVVTIRGSDNMKIYGSIKVGVHIDDSLWEE